MISKDNFFIRLKCAFSSLDLQFVDIFLKSSCLWIPRLLVKESSSRMTVFETHGDSSPPRMPRRRSSLQMRTKALGPDLPLDSLTKASHIREVVKHSTLRPSNIYWENGRQYVTCIQELLDEAIVLLGNNDENPEATDKSTKELAVEKQSTQSLKSILKHGKPRKRSSSNMVVHFDLTNIT